jgi:membrane fusion protein, multidrug efflux system
MERIMSRKGVVLLFIGIVVVLFLVLVMGAVTAKKKQKQEELPPISVVANPMTVGSIEEVVSYSGSLEGREQAQVVSQTAGVVTRVNFNAGDGFHAGQVMVEVESSQQEAAVDQAEAQVLAADTAYDKAQNDLNRIQRLYDSQVASKDNLEQAQLGLKSAYAQKMGAQAGLKVARKQLSDTRIPAPINGMIGNREVTLGQTLTPGTPIATVIDDREFLLKVYVPEAGVAQIKSGQTVDVSVDALGGALAKGRVRSVGLAFEQGGSAYPVEIIIPRVTGMRAGMFARCIVSTARKDGTQLVPATAILRIDNLPYVYIAENGKAVLKKVEIGLQNDREVEILTGITPADRVITTGKDQVTDGVKIQ